MIDLQSFRDLGISENVIKALHKKGFEEPSPIQKLTIPKLLTSDLDIVAQAQTGTGKTAAFGIPIVEMVDEDNKHVQAIVLTPTRELAMQVSEEINSFRGTKKINIAPVYGGASIENQISKIRRGLTVVVGTPGRVIDLVKRGILDLSHVNFFVLDEADEMLNMGFIDDIKIIIDSTNPDRKTLLFSATLPREIIGLAKNYMKEYETILVKKDSTTTNLTDQMYFEVNAYDKLEALCRVFDITENFYGLVFCKTKVECDEVSHRLSDRGYDADCIHGDLSQGQREKILNKFKTKRINILVATDVAARGIDINNLTHVINYTLPQDTESYVHRIGRTGRAGNEGTAITFVTPKETRNLFAIAKSTNSKIRKEPIPNVQSVIQLKKQRIQDQISTGAEVIEPKDSYLAFAREILINANPEEVLASTLKIIFDKDLDPTNYYEIKETKPEKFSDDRFGSNRFGDRRGRDGGDRYGNDRGGRFDRGGDRDNDRGGRFESRDDRGRDGGDRYGNDRGNDRGGRFESRGNERGGDRNFDKNSVRLFVGMGKEDGLSKRDLVEMIADKSKVSERNINEVLVLDSCSFLTVPQNDANSILDSFKFETKGKKPLIEVAKVRK